MSEEDKSQSMSDKDRTMANRFGGEANEDAPEKDDDDDEKDEKKDEKRPPKRALFLPAEKDESASSVEKTEEDKPKRNLFSGFLRTDAVPEEKTEQVPEENPHEVVEVTAEDASNEQDVEAPAPVPEQTGEAEQEATREEFQEVVLDRIGEVEAELETKHTEEEATEVLANADFLEQVGERLEEGMAPEEAIDDALEDQIEPVEADATPADLKNVANFEPAEEEEEAVIPPVATPVRPTRVPPRPPLPPVPPVTPYMPPSPGGPPHNPNLPSGGAISPNMVRNDPDVEQMNDYYYRKRRSGDLLLGGVVGYLLGKRRGRRATEAKFEPELRKRDDAIGDLKDKLMTSEEKVRALASAKSAELATVEANAPKTEVVQKVVPVVEAKTEYVEVPSVEVVTQKIESLPVDTIEVERQTLVEQEKVFLESIEVPVQEPFEPEKLSELLTRSEVVEQLQTVAEKVIVEKEAGEATATTIEKIVEVPQVSYERGETKMSQSNEKQVSPPAIEAKKDPRTMTMHELLEVADHIFLEKTSVRELYEHHRIDAVNLRRVVLEYMNGGTRYEKVLRRSLEAVEMQRELRNEIRHDPSATFNANDESAGRNESASDSSDQGKKDALTGADVRRQQNSYTADSQQEKQPSDEQLMISNGTAIVVGVLMGIAIMIVLFLYAR